MFKFLNRETKKDVELQNFRQETDAVLNALATKREELYEAIEKAMQRELKERKS